MKLSEVLKPNMKGVFYGRHSTKEQDMSTQKTFAYNLAEKYQCTIIDDYLDKGISARNAIEKRPELSRLLEDASKKRFDFVVIYDHDRLAREPEDHDEIRITMAANEIPIVESSTETLYDSGDKIVRMIKDALAKYELEKIRGRTRDNAQSLFKRGNWIGGRAPFGYRYQNDKKKFNACQEELELVRRIFDYYKRNVSFESIAKKLPANSYRGKDWNKWRVKAIITNPFYAGYMTMYRSKETQYLTLNERDQWVMVKTSKIDPVITKEEWEYCWKLFEERSKRQVSPKFYNTSFFFQGIIKCREKNCNEFLVTKDHTKKTKTGNVYGKRIYRCMNCEYIVDADKLHRFITKWWSDISKNDQEKIFVAVQQSIQSECHELENEINSLNEAVTEYSKKLNEINFEISTHFRELEKRSKVSPGMEDFVRILNLTRNQLKKQIENTEAMIVEKNNKMKYLNETEQNGDILKSTLDEFYKPLDKMSIEDIRRWVLYFVSEITIDKTGMVNSVTRCQLGDSII